VNLPFLSTERTNGWLKPFAGATTVLVIVTLFLFWDSTKSSMTLFSNDGPLGSISTDAIEMPGTFFGYWHDLNWLGYEQPSASPGIYMALGLLLQKSVLYLKWCTPICLIILGMSAWFFFRTLGLRNLACTIGAVAAAFNMEVVSYACWGLPSRALTFATTFLAAAFILRALKSKPWANLALAGVCVGLGLMEGYDIGALFSLYIAAFVLFGFVIKPLESGKQTALGQAIGRGAAGVAVVALVAGLAASQTMSTLVGTQLQGSTSGQGNNSAAAKEQQWNFLTQWSLPKMEALRIVVPGFFGYRLDTPRPYDADKIRSLAGGNYWGAVGQDPMIERIEEVEEVIAAFGQRNVLPGELAQVMGVKNQEAARLMQLVQNKRQFLQRHSGSGEYAGVIVVLLAICAILFALQKRTSLYSPTEKRMILFWAGLGVISLLLAFGRHAIFYQFIYQLPFFNTMRNTIKFLHPMHFAIIVLCGYGVEGMIRLARQETEGSATLIKKWVMGFAIAAGACLLFSLVMGASKGLLAQHIAGRGFTPETAATMAAFSSWELIITALIFGIGVFLITKTLRSKASPVFGIGLVSLIALDLTRANIPWVQYDDYKDKYESSNPLIGRFKQSPHEGRVTISQISPDTLQQLYGVEWLQHQFLYNNIQSIDVVQAPRMASDHEAFERRFTPVSGDTNTYHLIGRRWELTNTRWILGGTNDVAFFNQRFDPGDARFTVATNFFIGVSKDKSRYTTCFTPTSQIDQQTFDLLNQSFDLELSDGTIRGILEPCSLIRFDGALPRAKLYSHWQVQTNDTTTLETLAKRDFDSHASVIVNSPIAPSQPALGQAAGTVNITAYKPKEIQLMANATSESVLLLNDHWSPHWQVSINGQPAELLRCNHVMRGVRLAPGQHSVVFRFQPPNTWLYVSLASLLGGFGLLGFIMVDERKKQANIETS